MIQIDYTKEKKPFGFIYITTDKTNGKRYIGQRKVTKKIDDDNYLGSGTRLWNAIRKHGKENFSKEIIEECWSREELNDRERFWIDYYDAQRSDDFYNIAEGGTFGDVWEGLDEETKKRISEEARQRNFNREYDPKYFLRGEDNGAFNRHWYKDIISHKQYYLYEDDPLIEQLHLVKGMFRTEEHNRKIGEGNKGVPKPNKQKGMICLTDGKKNIFSTKEDLNSWLEKGYVLGCRSIKGVNTGKIKVNDGHKTICIKPEELDKYLELGYTRGDIASRRPRKRRTKQELYQAKLDKLKELGLDESKIDMIKL